MEVGGAAPGEKGDAAAQAPTTAAAAAAAPAPADGKDESNGDEAAGHEWQEVVVPPNCSVRGREWRIVVETCQVVRQTFDGQIAPGKEEGVEGTGGGLRRVQIGMEVELREVWLAFASTSYVFL